MKIKKFSELNEGLFDMMFDDPGNAKALRGYTNIKDEEFTIITKEPLKVITKNRSDYDKLYQLLNRYECKPQVTIRELEKDEYEL